MLNIVKKYLNINKYYDKNELFEDTFLSHPNYPSLYAVTDSLSYLSIENLAVKIPKEQFVELPKYFLTFFKDELVLIKKENSSVLIENEKGKKQYVSTDDFLKDWNQIVVVTESNTQENKLQLKNSYSKWLLYLLPVTLLIFLSVFSNKFIISNFFILGTTLIGLVVSVLILQEKFGIKTELGSKFCNMTSNASCDSVIKSDKGEIFKGLSFYDLPILFFGINFSALLLNPESTSFIIIILSFTSVPFLLYSVWLQKAKIKKWCLLCLAVSFIILLQGLGYFLQNVPSTLVIEKGIVTYLFSSVLIISVWYFLKPIFEKEKSLKNEVNTLKRFKRNFKVFKSFTKEIEIQKGFENLKGIEFGDSNAIIKLTLLLSPSCGHCHKAFKDAKELYENNQGKVYLKILFNVNPENEDNPYLSIVETLLSINSSDHEAAKEALYDWHVKNMSLDKWKEKWLVETQNMLTYNQIQKQYDWCLENNFNYTPVKIINQNLFPNEYELNDLNYFISDYSEEEATNIKENFKIV